MIPAAVVLVFHILGFISSIHAIMATRTSQGAIAWAVSLNTFPYLTVPAYWILGRNKFRGYVVARRSSGKETEKLRQEFWDRLKSYFPDETQKTEATLAAEQLAQMPMLTGNQAQLLIDGDATFSSIIEGIDKAEKYILFQFFIVKDDGIGRKIKSHLIAKALQGVKVYFIYDEVGSNALPRKYLKELREAGIEATEFNTRKGRGNRFQLNFRNHRKLVVTDGKIAWIGGHNVGDEYLGKDPKFGHWRDTHVKIEGPSVLNSQISFVEDWRWATGKTPALSWEPHSTHTENDARVLIIPTGPADEVETANLMFAHALNSAKKRIWISSPYFVPDHSIIVALQLACLRGVDVRILIPDMPDHLLVFLAAYAYFGDVGKTGVKFYRYKTGFLHEKAMLIDDGVATIGTANFDNRSFRLNFEITAAIYEPNFVIEVEKMFEDDFANSRLMEQGEYERKPWWFRFGVKLATLTSPVQ